MNIGGINKEKCKGDWNTFESKSKEGWTLPVSELQAGKFSEKNVETLLLFTSFTVLPLESWKKIDELKIAKDENGLLVEVDCALRESAPALTYTINKVDYNILAKDYINEVKGVKVSQIPTKKIHDI